MNLTCPTGSFTRTQKAHQTLRVHASRVTNLAVTLVTNAVVTTLIHTEALRGALTKRAPPPIVLTVALRILDTERALPDVPRIRVAPAVYVVRIRPRPVHGKPILPAKQNIIIRI